MDMGLGRLREVVMDREAWRAVVHGVTKSRDMTEWLNRTELKRYLHPDVHCSIIHNSQDMEITYVYTDGTMDF